MKIKTPTFDEIFLPSLGFACCVVTAILISRAVVTQSLPGSIYILASFVLALLLVSRITIGVVIAWLLNICALVFWLRNSYVAQRFPGELPEPIRREWSLFLLFVAPLLISLAGLSWIVWNRYRNWLRLRQFGKDAKVSTTTELSKETP